MDTVRIRLPDLVRERHRFRVLERKARGRHEIELVVGEVIDDLFDLVGGVRAVPVHRDGDVTRGRRQPRLVRRPVALSLLEDDFRAQSGGDLGRAVRSCCCPPRRPRPRSAGATGSRAGSLPLRCSTG